MQDDTIKINTLNESRLHKTLKKLYTLEHSGKTEVKEGPYIADIECPGKKIIEIQTSTLASLAKKTEYFLKNGFSVKIVYPLPEEKVIVTLNSDGSKLSRRKSPLKKNLISVFRELTALTDFLTEKKFSLDVLHCSIVETRIKTENMVQSKNRRRRHLKDWVKTGKELSEIKKRTVFSGKTSYRKLIPFKKEKLFTVKELTEAFIK
ncbi:MAG: hypothetical protein J5780_07130, partial [Treponema sp.]|nr:hypothetical protein [Treponema sp.]